MNADQKANVITEARAAATAFIAASNLFSGAASGWKYTLPEITAEDFERGANAGLRAEDITAAFAALNKAIGSLSDEEKAAIHRIRA